MFQKIAKHRANDASNDVHRPPLILGPQEGSAAITWPHLGILNNFPHFFLMNNSIEYSGLY